MVISSDDVSCTVVFDTQIWLVCLCRFMWSELLMTSAISSPVWSSVYECPESGVCVHISSED